MPSFVSVSFGSPYVHYANNNAGDTYDSNLTAIFTGFTANANIQISCTEYTNQEDFYNVQTSYSAPYTTVTCQKIFDDYYANSSNLSLPCVWTFTDLNNVGSNVATATFALPMTTITGNTIYQSYNINDLNEYNIYNYCNFLQLGNACTVNLLTLYPFEEVTFTGGFANGTFRSPTYSTLGTVSADANGVVAYTFSVQQNSNAFYLAVSSNTVNYTYGGIIFDQNEINVANGTVIEGYAWTPYDYQNSNTAILANVSVYANSTLLGNTTTNVHGFWSYQVPNTMSFGTYLITSFSVPQNPSAIISQTIPYSNASAFIVIQNSVTLNFIQPPEVGNGFTFFDDNNIMNASVTVYVDNFTGTVNSVTTAGNFTVDVQEGVPPNPESIYPANFAYTIVLNVATNGTQTAQQVSNAYQWTFKDSTGNSCTATFSIPTISVQGVAGTIGTGSNASQILYSNTNLNYLYGTDSPFYQTVMLGNSVEMNVLGCLPNQNVYVLTVDNISGDETITYSNANANGVYNCVAIVNGSSDNYSFLISGYGYYNPYTPNTVAGGGFTVQSPIVLFDQTTIVANTNLFHGYAFQPYGSYPASIVSLYANGTLLSNVTTSTTGSWSYVPSLSTGTYEIVAAARPSVEPYNNTFTWLYSNASTQVVIDTNPPIPPSLAITYPSNGQTVYSTLIEGTSSIVGTVHLYNGATLIANASSGNYTWNATPTLSYGTYIITAEEANANGIAYANVSFDYAQPINIRLQWDTGYSSTDNVSSQSTIIGTVIPNTVVSVYDGVTGNFLANITPDGVGNIVFDYDYEVGDVSLTFQQIVGNTVYTQPFSFYFDNQYGTYEFLSAILNLLPEGAAWAKFSGSNMYTALRALMRVYRRVSGRVTDYFSEAFVPTTNEMLPEWEATLGIVPNDNETIAERQANATAKFIEVGGQSVEYFENVANSFGYTVTIVENTNFRCGTNSSVDLIPAENYVFYWHVVANSSANGSTMQSEIDEYAPAHTIVHWKFD